MSASTSTSTSTSTTTTATEPSSTTTPSSRPRILYPDSGPTPPFPLRMEGEVISGFGRGSKELGIPTANLPVDSSATPWIDSAKSGVYFGWASLKLAPTHPDSSPSPSSSHPSNPPSTPAPSGYQIHPMVMSIGYNPFYKNAVRSAEVHLLHRFASDFYGCPMRLLILGYVREELDYAGLEALVADINIDCEVARRSLAREAWVPREGVVVEEGKEGLQRGTLDGSWLVREE
ncbi:hypothetical protein F4810DRAFT_669179 [Camillea tinctor]|nr:hypothetical protein F4810DRAFT_669179 [Camillea tinctor]